MLVYTAKLNEMQYAAIAILSQPKPALFRTLMQAQGLLTDKVEVTTTVGANDVDSMKAEIERINGGQ